MAHKKEENETTKEPTSFPNVAVDLLTGIVLLIVGVIIDVVESHFNVPVLISLIIHTCDFALFLFFLAKVVQAARAVFKEFDDLVLVVKDSNTVQLGRQLLGILFRQLGKINFKAIAWRTIFRQLGIAFGIAVVIVLILVAALNITVLTSFWFSTILPALKNLSGFAAILSTLLIPLVRLIFQGKDGSTRDQNKQS